MQRHWRDTGAGRLEVIESGGTGATVFLCHGNSGCAEDFAAWIDGPLGQRLRLVSISLPGHGHSDRAHDPSATYQMAGFGSAVAQVIASYGCASYGLVGQSLGGHVLLESLADLPGASSLLLLSSPPLSLDTLPLAFQPDPTGGALFSADLSPAQTEALVQAFVNTTTGPWADRVRQSLVLADPRMRPCLGASLSRLQDEHRLLREARVPVALMAGGEDAFLRADYLGTLAHSGLWGGGPRVCAGRPHALHLAAADEAAEWLLALLPDTRKAGA